MKFRLYNQFNNIDVLNDSKNSIDIAIYGYSRVSEIEKALLNAQKRGVNIRLIYDSDKKGNNIFLDLDIIEANFDAGEVVNSETLRAKSLIGKAELPLKILANGEITKAVTVQAVKFSAAAAAKIEAAGGKVEVIA